MEMHGLALSLALALSGPAAEASVSAEASTDAGASGDASADSSGETRPMRKFAPERNMFELGLWVGILIPNSRHEFYDPRTTGQIRYKPVAADLGLRFAYFPLRWLGGELEVGFMPTQTDPGANAFLYTVRGHAIFQLPWWRLTPFLVVGGGGMGVASGAQGDDIDAGFHWGPGLKFFINRYLALRLDLRHLVGARVGANDGATSHGEVLLGLSVTLGRKKDKKREDDRDGDGYSDSEDKCPDEPGVHPDGCPAPDRDNDGIGDAADKCPDEPGPKPDGCPIADQDKDGIADDEDQCKTEPESKNSYEDDDGCPDEVPKKLRGATGVMPGIEFELNSDKVKRDSRPTLNQAASTLEANPDYEVEIVGHTDSTGSREYNQQLSQKRADSVKRYLVRKGVEEERIKTRGAGPDEPIADNDTEEGRAKNRRIEFKVRKQRRGRRGAGGER